MEPVSPALAGKFLSTVPPRKPPNEFFGQPSNYLEWVQPTLIILGFPGGSVGKKKNLLAMQVTSETWVRFLGQEDPLEEEMATYSSILAWEIPQPEEPGGLLPRRSQSRTGLK